MKITQSATRFYMGTSTETRMGGNVLETGQNKKTSKIFAGNTNITNSVTDSIAQKREEARAKAKKIVGDVFAAEKTVDDDLAERANRIKESEQSIVNANKELAKLREEQDELKEQYGITGEETEDMLPEEYKMERDELNRYGEPYRAIIAEAQDVIKEERAIISAVKIERLKSSPMVAASKEAEDVMEAANKEVISMLIDDTKDNIEEDMEKDKEKQEELKEEKELEEAKREEKKQKQAELTDVPVQGLLQLEQIKDGVKQEVDTMLTDMKLLAEDIKGSLVDTEL